MSADSSATLAERTWQTSRCQVLFVPLGSTEQHGPHLPLGTDATVAQAVARDLTARSIRAGSDAAAAPVLGYGASGEHEAFSGTISIGTAVLTTVLVEIGRSAGRWAPRLVFVNGHGGNVDAVRAAVRILRDESRDVGWLACAAPPLDDVAPDAHAGRTETSLMLHLAPGLVRTSRVAAGQTRPLREILPDLQRAGLAGVSANGVLGDPAGASADEGAMLLTAMCDRAWSRMPAGDPV